MGERMALEWELATFQRMKPELLAKHAGRWALIHKDRLVGVFDTYRDASEAGWAGLGMPPWLIKQITEREERVVMSPRVVTCLR